MSTTTQVSIINQNAISATLSNRKERVAKAVKYVDSIPAIITDDASDDKAKMLIGKYKELAKNLNDERTPITKIFDEIRSKFTDDEKSVAAAIDALSKRRDKFVADKAAAIKKAAPEAQNARFKNEEFIDLKAQIDLELVRWVNGYIEAKKQAVLKAIETVTAENKDAKIQGLTNMSCEFDPLKYGMFESKAVSKYDNNVSEISKNIVLDKEAKLLQHYKKEIETFKHECLMQINSLVMMDLEQKKAAIEEKVVEIKVETSTANEVAQVEISHQADTEKAESAFTSLAAGIDTSLPTNRQSVQIEVLNNAGWIAINQFWLVTLAPNFEGNFETKTLKSMKLDVEKYAKDKGVKIESVNLVYSEKIKAIN